MSQEVVGTFGSNAAEESLISESSKAAAASKEAATSSPNQVPASSADATQEPEFE